MIKQYFQLIDTQAHMKMKAQANRLVLSYIWWVLEPLLFVSLFYLVFEYLLQRGGEGFFLFLIVGKTIYLWFSKSIITASTGLIQNKGIIGQRALPKWIFPMVNIQETLYKSIVAFLLLFFVLWFNGCSPYLGYWQLLPLLFCTYLLICAVGLFSSLLVAIAEDFSNLIQLAMMGMMFGSGIFWDINSIENEKARDLIFLLNPLASIIDGFRAVLIDQKSIEFMALLPALVFSMLLLSFSFWLFSKFNNQLSRAIL